MSVERKQHHEFHHESGITRASGGPRAQADPLKKVDIPTESELNISEVSVAIF
jgi:hypothetical protein